MDKNSSDLGIKKPFFSLNYAVKLRIESVDKWGFQSW